MSDLTVEMKCSSKKLNERQDVATLVMKKPREKTFFCVSRLSFDWECNPPTNVYNFSSNNDSVNVSARENFFTSPGQFSSFWLGPWPGSGLNIFCRNKSASSPSYDDLNFLKFRCFPALKNCRRFFSARKLRHFINFKVS